MNFRQFFTDQTWWGKLIGAFFGFLMAGPVGAFLGILIGNLFDKGLVQHYSNPHIVYREESRENIQSVFIEGTFSLIGYLAKIDGRVSEQEILMASSLMKEMGLSKEQKKLSRHYFNQGKDLDFKVQPILNKLIIALQDNNNLLKLFADILFRAAQVDGLTSKKITALNHIFNVLGLASLENQHRFYQSQYQERGQYSHRQYSSSSRSQSYYTPPNELDAAYRLLHVKPGSSQQDIKKAYQRLISRNHPDKLIAKGMSEEHIKIANEKTQRIRKAYEQICTAKGWM